MSYIKEMCGVCCGSGKVGTEQTMDQRDCPHCNGEGCLKVTERVLLTPKELKSFSQQLGGPIIATCFVTTCQRLKGTE